MNLLVLLLIALPACLAQFSIQGPSDGNRVAQGLRIEEGKGIEYTGQNAGHEGGFSIQGASDGHSQVQSGSDGHSNFQIQGASHAGAERYTLQGPVTGSYTIQGSTAEHQSGIIQGQYDSNPGSTKALQYDDPSGLRVNWRSYDRQPRPRNQQESQYSEPVVQSPPRAQPRQRPYSRHPQPASQPQPIAIQQSKNLNAAPSHIKQLLQFQAQIPYVNIVPEPFRFEALLATQGASRQQPEYQSEYQPEHQEQQAPEPRRPSYHGKPRGPPRQRRQAPQHRSGPPQQQYRRIAQPPTDPQISYSPNLPSQLQQLLKYQAQTPYVNIIPEQYRFNPESAAQTQLQEFRSHYQDLIRQQPKTPNVHTAIPATAPRPAPLSRPDSERAHYRERRQAPHQSQYRPRQQPLPAEPSPQYSTNLPRHLQSLLNYQAQIPYNIIANQINYRPDKPYVPQPVQQSAPSPQAQYQSQGGDAYQGEQSGHNQVYDSQAQYPQYAQAPLGYQQPRNGVRPVTENQY